jgi:cbb3-type cytochrome oxidase subunit 3
VLFISFPLPLLISMVGVQVARWLLVFGLVGQIWVGLMVLVLFAGVLWLWQKERKTRSRRRRSPEEIAEREEDRWIRRHMA